MEQEIRAGDGDPHEHAAVEVRPEGEERRQHPDRLRRQACLVAQDEQDDREQREREELAAHDEQRLRRGHRHEQEHESRRGIGGVGAPHVERERGHGEEHGADEREQEPAVAERGFEPVERELAEHRCVLPARRGSGRIGNAGGDLAELDDLASERGQPVCIRTDRGEERTERDDERAREPREPRRPLRQRIHPTVIGRERPNLQSRTGYETNSTRTGRSYAPSASARCSSSSTARRPSSP